MQNEVEKVSQGWVRRARQPSLSNVGFCFLVQKENTCFV